MRAQIDRVGNPENGYVYKRRENYGRFGEVIQQISYFAHPKRPVGTLPGTQRFRTWALGPDKVSQPYGPIKGERGLLDPEMRMLMKEKEVAKDQADGEDDPDEFGVEE
jgi:hypothetical protein